MIKPTFSIIIPTLNEEKFLPHLLQSLVTQSYKDFEVIVVDGASKDKTVEVAMTYIKKVPHLTVVTSPKHGASAQRNFGASLANGEWFLFIDADSVLLPYSIERVYEYLQSEKPDIFTTWFSPDTRSTNDAMVALFGNMVIEGGLLLHHPVAPGPFMGVSASSFRTVGGYDESVSWGEDYDLTKRICQKGTQLSMIRETLYIYSLRRMRHQGTLRLAQTYTKAIFSVLLTNKPPSSVSGYVMGGQPYAQKKKRIKSSGVRVFTKKFREILNELFDH